ncbi:hypothetical protein IFM89_000170 [Coptis chinensis]|uniref:Glucose-methanol-choline oxidoreductase N-terminal domain-containing protein n=1 Tax=Coptis chinensis TaxID=261450 RepID=A0A835H268_9MAGN|nr:hypothetical protein IFM89_000170 [Coptis chinensis]
MIMEQLSVTSLRYRAECEKKKVESGEQVLLWLASLVESLFFGEAIQGWIPLRNDSFEKLEKICVVVSEEQHMHQDIILGDRRCEGAMGSPQILMLSGIGPSELLSKFNIAPMIDAPQVGQDIRDHPGIKFLLDAGIGNVPPAQPDPSQVVGIASSSRFLFQYGGGSKTSARPRRVLLGKLAYPSSKGKLELE